MHTGHIDGLRVRYGGQAGGSAVLLLHGFPQTHRMWDGVIDALQTTFTLVAPDLPGYGDSDSPRSDDRHAPYSKRAMGDRMIGLMERLGHRTFSVVGHDRGGRVAYRTALDHPKRIRHLVALDVVPIDAAWDRADARLALGFWPWSLLAQDAPLPERLIAGDPEAVLSAALDGGWGTPAETFGPDVRAAYLAQLRDPAHRHGICEEYRAAAGIDREHDAADRAAGRHIACPTLVLWSASGPLGSWYEGAGGPLALWRGLAGDLIGRSVPGGHFFPEEHPGATAQAISDFIAGPV